MLSGFLLSAFVSSFGLVSSGIFSSSECESDLGSLLSGPTGSGTDFGWSFPLGSTCSGVEGRGCRLLLRVEEVSSFSVGCLVTVREPE